MADHNMKSIRSKALRISATYAFFLAIGLLATGCHSARESPSHNQNQIPKRDYDQRNYYLIKVQSSYTQEQLILQSSWREQLEQDQPPWTIHKDQQLLIGDLLGLRFESQVGTLPDYFLYSSPKPTLSMNLTLLSLNDSRVGAGSNNRNKQSHHSKRSFLVSDSLNLEEHSEIEEKEGDERTTMQSEEPDDIVKRFHQLKKQYAESKGRNKRQKRHDEQSDIVGLMSDIHKQELRQRIRKRAPLPDAYPDAQALTQREDDEDIEIEAEEEELSKEEQAIMEEEEENDKDNTEFEDQFSEQEEMEDAEVEDTEVDNEEGIEGIQDLDKEYQPVGESQPEDGMAESLGFEDPGFRYQWHLHNTKDRHDINVTGVWEQGINGTGVNVAIIDDGLDMDSEDLAPNFFKEGSWDFNDHTKLPKPRLIDDRHGTRCAGEIASAKNGLCGVGVAYGAKVAGLRILSGQITDADEAVALNYHFQENHIYSCSWGPPDDGRSMEAPKGVIMDAMINGIKNGRSGLGSIYVFATGNGGSQDDDCNFDGYTNSLYTVSIGAIDRAQRHPYYSEACSAQLAVTYSSGGGSAIYTCDVGERRCFGQHGGTSAAAPIVAGMIALVLSVRPDLTWRDVQYLLMATAIPISLDDPDWKETASGRLFNHKFGYGSLDAYRLVEAAKNFKSLRPQTYLYPPVINVKKTIPQGGKGVSSTFKVTKEDLEAKEVRLGNLEHITVTVNIEHKRRGDVEVILTSPNNIESRLGVKRRHDTATTGFVNWTFMTVKHWEENPIGNWTLTVRDQDNPTYRGKFIDWRIKFWGERSKEIVDKKIQSLNELPTEEDMEQDQELYEVIDNIDGVESNDHSGSITDGEFTVSGDPSVVKESGEKEGQEVINDEMKETKDGLVKGNADAPYGEVAGEDMTQNKAPSESSEEEVGWIVETESEEELASIVSHTFYIFCSVLAIGGLIIGFIIKRKSDSRGRGNYVGIHANLLDMNVQDFENDDEDNIDLLPHGNNGSNSSRKSVDGGEDEEYRNGDKEFGTSYNGGKGVEMKSILYNQQQQLSQAERIHGNERDIDIGDADEEGFFVAPSSIQLKGS